MFSSQQNDARKKFWQTAELIEHLLPFLDFESTLKLAQSHALTLNILQIDTSWTKIIRRERPWPRKWSLDLEIEEPLLSALSSILSRQKLSESLFTFSSVKIETMKSALAFNTLMHSYPCFTSGIKVCGENFATCVYNNDNLSHLRPSLFQTTF